MLPPRYNSCLLLLGCCLLAALPDCVLVPVRSRRRARAINLGGCAAACVAPCGRVCAAAAAAATTRAGGWLSQRR
uniref:Secreted protein n=1 Tax=Leersia perrieri TaxID=77586 RepID=A0A0D9V2K4_9ORYZ